VNLKSKLPTKLQKYASFGVIPKLLLAPVAFLILLGFSLARPFVQFRLYRMVDTRIGHLSANTEMIRLRTLSNNYKNAKKTIIVYCSESRNPANRQLLKMFFRNSLHLRGPIAWATLTIAIKVKIFNFHSSEANKYLQIDREGLLVDSKFTTLRFLDLELQKGEAFLDSVQADPKKIVCLNVRDNSYLYKALGFESPYHNFRNSEISTYRASAERLAEMGYTVFRMGSSVNEPLASKHYRVIDYAINGMRTELRDIYLGAVCKFCISTGSGWDGIPTIFRRPIMFLNCLPVFAPTIKALNSVVYPKSLVEESTESPQCLESLIKLNLAKRIKDQVCREAFVKVRDLSSEELVEAVTEMAQRVEGTFVETPEQKEMQAKLKRILSTHPQLQPSPNYYPIRAQFASCFLSRYPNFLDGLE
jgi:putative glycosyltransferase (TIGR04372 family)